MPFAKDQWEEETIVRLTRYLAQTRSQTYAITGRDVVVDALSQENFDYQLTSATGQQVAIEIVRLVESGDELATAKIWNQAVGQLKQYLADRHLKGYLVTLPSDLGIRFRDIGDYVARVGPLIETAISVHPDTERFTVDGITIYRVSDLDVVGFGTTVQARYVNPHGTAGRVLHEKLEKKNRQLAVANHERILLVANWAIIVNEPDMVRALALIPFEVFPNVDTIIFEERAGQYYHVFDRLTYTAILTRDLSLPTNSDLLHRYLGHQLAEGRRSAYEFVVARSEREGAVSWFDGVGAREQVVKYLVDDAESCDEELLWAMRMFKDDPDPPADGANYPEYPDGDHNCHLSVLRGENSAGITTVRGHLCRLLIKVVCRNKPEYYDQVLDIVEQYVTEPNLYIRTQALDVLAELGVRLRCDRREDGTAFDWSAESRARVIPLIFRALRENQAYPRVLHRVLHGFEYIRILAEDDAKELLSTMLRTKERYILHDLAPLLLFYALFRERTGSFDSRFFRQTLKTQLVSGEPALRDSLAWHFWNILCKKDLAIDEITPYLRLFWDGSYDQGLAARFDLLWEELLKTDPELGGELFERMLIKLAAFIAEHPDVAPELWITKAADMMPALAGRPSALIDVIRQLEELSKRGVFIFDMENVLSWLHHGHLNPQEDPPG